MATGRPVLVYPCFELYKRWEISFPDERLSSSQERPCFMELLYKYKAGDCPMSEMYLIHTAFREFLLPPTLGGCHTDSFLIRLLFYFDTSGYIWDRQLNIRKLIMNQHMSQIFRESQVYYYIKSNPSEP
jgi:hypothetical protein